MTCVVCGRSIPGDPHYPHQPWCNKVQEGGNSYAFDCDCDNPCHPDCCWTCSADRSLT